jgi:hypothetical protein
MWHVINKHSLAGGRKREERLGELRNVACHKRGLTCWREEEGGAAWWASKRSTSQTSTHQLEGREREKRLGEFRNVVRHKRPLTSWRGGRGRSGLVSFKTWHVTDEDSPTGGEEEGGAALWASKCGMSQTSTHSLEGGRGRSGLVSFETWNVTNDHSLPGGEEEGGAAWWALKRGTSQTSTHSLEGRKREERLGELRNVACYKRALTDWRGGRGRSKFVSFETWHVTNEDLPTGGEEEGGAGWWASKHCTTETSTHFLTMTPVSTS